MAINCCDIRGTTKRIKTDGINYEVRKVPVRPLQQVFLHDPGGVMIELNFWHEADVPEIDREQVLPGERARKEREKEKKAKGKKQLVGAK